MGGCSALTGNFSGATPGDEMCGKWPDLPLATLMIFLLSAI